MIRQFRGATDWQVSPTRYEVGGEGGIRTPGTLRPSGFQDRRDRPLCHLSFVEPPTLCETTRVSSLEFVTVFGSGNLFSMRAKPNALLLDSSVRVLTDAQF